MRVLVAEPLDREGLDLMGAEHEIDYRPDIGRPELLLALAAADALVVRSGVKVDAQAIAAGPQLKVIGRAGVGVDNIDVPAATAAGILVVNAPTANTLAAAELTMALMLAVMRNVTEADASLHRGEWRRSQLMGHELHGRTLGIVGLGRIGMAVASRARSFEMEIIAYDPLLGPDAAVARGVPLIDLKEVLRRSDVLTLHLPLNDFTRHLIDGTMLALMKPSAYLVDVARGGVVDEEALADALCSGRLAGAAMDVYEHEPLTDSALLHAPHTVLTPHLGASTAEAQQRAGVEVAGQVLDALAGRPARFAVNSVTAGGGG